MKQLGVPCIALAGSIGASSTSVYRGVNGTMHVTHQQRVSTDAEACACIDIAEGKYKLVFATPERVHLSREVRHWIDHQCKRQLTLIDH
jgi:hypothetical protein